MSKFRCMDCNFIAEYGSDKFMKHKKEKHWRGYVFA